MSIKKNILFILLAFTLIFNSTTAIPTSVFANDGNITNITQQKVTFNIHSQWNGQYLGEIIIANTSDTTLSNWELTVIFPNEIVSMWNAIYSKEGNIYTLKGQDYNNVIYPNQTISIGFIANYDTNIKPLEDYVLKSNGVIIYTFGSNPEVYDPINNITTPSALQLDEPYETRFETSKDELWFSYTPQISASYEFVCNGSIDLCTTLYDTDKEKIVMNSDNGNTSFLGSTLLQNKTYYVKIIPKNYDSKNSNFSLVVNKIENPNDPLFGEQWALLNISTGIDINILPVWKHLNTNKSQTCIVDTGVYYVHEDLNNNINLDLSYNFTHHINNVFPENELYGDTYTAIYGHGTHVSGTIASETNNSIGIAGVVPNADLVSLKALGRQLKGSSSYTKSIAAFVEAVEYAKQNGIKLINCSFGGDSPSQAERDAMLGAKNILFVIAAGNSGCDLEEYPVYPACYYHTNSIVVANVNSYGDINSTSNYGGPTDIAAPGTDIMSTMPYNEYKRMSGTSMAAPFVSSICSLIWSKNNSLNPEQVKSYVTNPDNVTHLDTLENKTLSGGLLNAYKAVVCPSSYNGNRNNQALRDSFIGDKKERISFYKNIANVNSKTDEIIVSFLKPILIDEWIEKLNSKYDFKEVSVNGYLDSIDAYVLRFSSIIEADVAIDLLNEFNEVTYAEPNYIRE